MCPQPWPGAPACEDFLRGPGFLRQARQGVVFAEDADDRPALAVARHESGRHSRDPALDRETLRLGVVGERLRRTVFDQGRFGEAPDPIAELDELGFVLLDGGHGFLLFLHGGAGRELGYHQQSGEKYRGARETCFHGHPLFRIETDSAKKGLYSPVRAAVNPRTPGTKALDSSKPRLYNWTRKGELALMSEPGEGNSRRPRFKRSLGLFDATSMSVGAIIGAGIFVVTGIAAGLAGSALVVSMLIAAAISLFTALSIAELAAWQPVEGSVYEYTSGSFRRSPDSSSAGCGCSPTFSPGPPFP